MSGIRDVHGALVTLIAGLEITAPVALEMNRVYKFTPPASKALADVPCAIATFEQQPVVFGPGVRMKPYAVHIQLFAAPAQSDSDIGADIAAAFLDELIQALSGSIRLGLADVHVRSLRGSPETIAIMEWAGIGYVGLDLFLDVTITEAANNAA